MRRRFGPGPDPSGFRAYRRLVVVTKWRGIVARADDDRDPLLTASTLEREQRSHGWRIPAAAQAGGGRLRGGVRGRAPAAQAPGGGEGAAPRGGPRLGRRAALHLRSPSRQPD